MLPRRASELKEMFIWAWLQVYTPIQAGSIRPRRGPVSTDYGRRLFFFCFVWPLSWFRLVSVSSFFSYFILLLQVMEGKGEGGVGERGRHSCQRPGKDSHRHSIATLAVSVGTATNRIRHWAAMQTSRLRLSSIIRHFFFFCLVSVRMFVFVRNCRVKEEKNHWH